MPKKPTRRRMVHLSARTIARIYANMEENPELSQIFVSDDTEFVFFDTRAVKVRRDVFDAAVKASEEAGEAQGSLLD